jgi:hypothetical protein
MSGVSIFASLATANTIAGAARLVIVSKAAAVQAHRVEEKAYQSVTGERCGRHRRFEWCCVNAKRIDRLPARSITPWR